MSFQLVPKSMTLNDLERHNGAGEVRFGEWRRLCLSTLKLIQRVIHLASENS